MKIKMYGKKGEGLYTQVSPQDFKRVSKYKWYLSTGGYAITTIHRKGSSASSKDRNITIMLHRLILGEPPTGTVQGDHINRVRLDNRRGNLRWVSPQHNCHNSGGYGIYCKGVKLDGTRFCSKIRGIYLGSFATEKEAALVYDKAARHFFGEYAYLNFPEEYYKHPVRYIEYIPDKIKPKSKYIGVSYFGHGGKRVKRWRAVYRKKTLGYYLTEYEAAQSYKEAKHESYISNSS